jgi:hypothetical protein
MTMQNWGQKFTTLIRNLKYSKRMPIKFEQLNLNRAYENINQRNNQGYNFIHNYFKARQETESPYELHIFWQAHS